MSGQLKLEKVDKPHPFPPVSKWKFSQHHPFKAFYEHDHRSVYLLNPRLRRPAFFATFDGADANASTPTRPQSVTTPQALYFMNNERIRQVSENLAGRLLKEADEDKRITQTWLRLMGRHPTVEELGLTRAFLKQAARYLEGKTEAKDRLREQWASLARALFRTNEMLYVD